MMVEFFSQEIELRVCRYLSCIAAWLPAIVSLAALRATLALFSPSAAITWGHKHQTLIRRQGDTFALASLAASASAAMALWSCIGSLTSLLNTLQSWLSGEQLDLHLHPLHLHAPGVSSYVQSCLHVVSDLLPLRKKLVQALGAQDVPQRGGG